MHKLKKNMKNSNFVGNNKYFRIKKYLKNIFINNKKRKNRFKRSYKS